MEAIGRSPQGFGTIEGVDWDAGVVLLSAGSRGEGAEPSYGELC